MLAIRMQKAKRNTWLFNNLMIYWSKNFNVVFNENYSSGINNPKISIAASLILVPGPNTAATPASKRN